MMLKFQTVSREEARSQTAKYLSQRNKENAQKHAHLKYCIEASVFSAASNVKLFFAFFASSSVFAVKKACDVKLIPAILLSGLFFTLYSQNLDSLSRIKAAKEKYRPLRLESADEVEQLRIDGHDVMKAAGSVRFSQDTLSAQSDQAAFFRERQIALLIGRVVLHDGHRWIFSEKARYYSRQKKAVCEGNVLFVDGRTTLTADSLVYYQNIEQLYAQGNVVIYDSIESAASYGNEGFYDVKSKYSHAKGNPYLIQYDSTLYQGQNIARLKRNLPSPPKKDSLGNPLKHKAEDQITIRGQFVESYIDSHLVIVRDSVIFIRDKLTATSGKAVYQTKDELLTMTVNPEADYDKSDVKGDIITVQFVKREIEKMTVTGNAVATSLADSASGKRNRLNAKSIVMNIEERKMKTMAAEGNAYNRYYLENGDGVNEISGPKITLFFNDDSKLHNFIVTGGTEGAYFPKQFEYLIKK